MIGIQSLLGSSNTTTTTTGAGATATPPSVETNETAQPENTTGDTYQFSETAKALAATPQDNTVATPELLASNATLGGNDQILDGVTEISGDWSMAETRTIATASTASGRTVSVEQYSNASDLTDETGASLPSSGYKITISDEAGEETRSYALTGDIIINETDEGGLRVASYTPGRETSGDDIIIGAFQDGSVAGGAGDDTIVDLSLSSQAHISGGDGNDTIVSASLVSHATISGGDGNDTIIGTGILGGSIDTGAGNDTIEATILGSSGSTIIKTGSGDDSIKADFLGVGGQVMVDTGSGDDSIEASGIGLGGQVNVDMGSGDDSLHASSIGIGASGNTAQVNIDMGSGDDTAEASWAGLAVDNGKSQVNIAGGSGDDTINASWTGFAVDNGQTQVNIDGGSGDDTINASWTGVTDKTSQAQIHITGGSGDDTINTSWLGFSLNGGSSQVTIAEDTDDNTGTLAGMINLTTDYDQQRATKDLMRAIENEAETGSESGALSRRTSGQDALNRLRGRKAYAFNGRLNA